MDEATGKRKGNIFSRVTVWWLNETIERAKDGSLNEQNLGEIVDMKSTEETTDRLEDEWKREVERASAAGSRPKLWKAVLRSVDSSVIIRACLYGILDSTGRILQAVALSLILTELALGSHASMVALCLYAASMTFFFLIEHICRNEQYHHGVLAAVHVRAAITGLIQRKVLTLSSGSLAKISSGHIISLASQELESLIHTGSDLHGIIVVPLEVTAVSLLLWYLVGWQVLPGIGYVLLIIAFQTYMGSFVKKVKSERGHWTARRLHHVSDIIFDIRSIKANAWEDLMFEKVSKERRKELQSVWKLVTLQSAVDSFITSYPVLTILIVISSLVLTGQQLTPQKVFTTIALFGVLNGTAISLFIKTDVFLSHSISSLEKISRLLLESDLDASMNDKTCAVVVGAPLPQSLRTSENVREKETFPMIALHDISASLVKEEQSFQLRNISFKASGDQFIGITGPVGSGKSCILHSIIKNLRIDQGTIESEGKLIIVPQVPWVFSGTIRDNILFGQPLETKTYENVLDACALKADLKMFPKGDLTLIGERGISLSSGQQARVSLARAVYAEADIYLLDDTLSAIDSKIGQQIYQNCLNGILADRLRILVTHQVQYLEIADHILVLDNGAIISEGTYSQLSKNDPFFSKFVTDEEQIDKQRSSPSASSENGNTELCYRSDDEGIERASEDKVTRAVSLDVYWQYLKEGAQLAALLTFGSIAILPDALSVAFFLRLKSWTATSDSQKRIGNKLEILVALAGGTMIFAIVRSFYFFWIATNISKNLQDKMLKAVLHAPVRFFDTNPYRRIQNRFSMDIAVMDDFLPRHMETVMILGAFFIGTLVLISISYPWLILGTIPYVLMTVYVGSKGVTSGREIKRTEAITNTLVFEHISDCIQGVVSIRAHGMEKAFNDIHHRNQDISNKAIAASMFVFRWAAFRLALVSVLLVTAIVVSTLLLVKDPALCGLVLSFVIQLNKRLSSICLHLTYAQSSMVSVERVLAYTKLQPETGYGRDIFPAKCWPEYGAVTLKNLSLYYPNGTQVLKDLSCSIVASEKIGIVGRTGSGKSSLMAALLCMPEPQGEVIIDGVITSTLNVRALRASLAMIPQRPFVFHDTLRHNLDPWEQHSDTEIRAVLEKVQLKPILGSKGTLDELLQLVITEEGNDISVGERQLICLARALLQNAKIILLDEATAKIDYRTDRMIQDVIRKEMSQCTALTITNRLDTVLEYDRIMVLENGNIVEFDKPDVLLQKRDGVLSELFFSFQSRKENL